MEVPPPPNNPLFDLWLQAQVNAASLDVMLRHMARIEAAVTDRPFEEVAQEMLAERDRLIRQYMKQNRSE